MSEERWFPRKYQTSSGFELGDCLYSGHDWQIYKIGHEENLLIAKRALVQRWISEELVPEGIFRDFLFGDSTCNHFSSLFSGAGQRLEPVTECRSPSSKADGLSFAVSMRETRGIHESVPLQDAIYVERYSRLLPTWSVTENVDDEEVLGRWLTGGVSVRATSLRRLSSLLGWLDREDVRDLVTTAGLGVSTHSVDALRRSKRQEQQEASSAEVTVESSAHQSNVVREGKGLERRFHLCGRPTLETFFNEYVIDIVENADRYRAFGIEFPSAIVLHGPPGCGKTFAVERLVEYLDWPIFFVDSKSIGSPYIHETSRKIGGIFEEAVDAAPSMIVVDEMESYLSDRQIHGSTGLHHVEEVAEFLRRIPEANCRNVLVIGMTNRLEMIDPAILRRGRFDHVIEVGMPSAEEVRELIDSLLAKIPREDDIDIEKLVVALTGRALSDAAFLVREAARLAARSGKSTLNEESLLEAERSLPSREHEKHRIGFRRD